MMDSFLLMLKSHDLLSLFWLISSFFITCAHLIYSLDFGSKFNWFQYVIDLTKPLYYFGKLKPARVKKDGSVYSSRFINNLSSFPKRWFSHFYVAGILVHSLVFLLLILYIYQAIPLLEVPQRVSFFMYWLRPDAKESLSIWAILIVFACEELHLIRRVYECFFVSSFSNGTISIIHYFYGVAFYTMFGIGVLVSMSFQELFSLEPEPEIPDMVCYLLGVMVFLVASVFQHKAICSFAALRIKERDKAARGHYIPQGHLFQYISSPHYLCEILIYLSMCTITRCRNVYLMCSTTFVIVNQVSAALSVHQWYKKTFPNYPKNRKALVPYVL